MKINKVRIRNFKVFKDFLVDFSSSDTIVFDGPNGFGKTTIYDAIELALTGNIRRYDAMKRDLLDGRQTYTENPFFYENAAKEESISIQIQFTSNEKIFILERIAQSDLIGGLIDFKIYKLYSKTKFDDAERTLIEDEHSFLTEIFGKNYSSNFQFLNYVEQEECLFLLKNSDKGRKQHIAHLFDLKEF
ncbi:MAG: AAA family ATPase, partial [Ferruginibacter sp.]|nr:AAA family ATPase [Ferruginibacter sp.]